MDIKGTLRPAIHPYEAKTSIFLEIETPVYSKSLRDNITQIEYLEFDTAVDKFGLEACLKAEQYNEPVHVSIHSDLLFKGQVEDISF